MSEGDVSLIQDEDVLRRMWQQTEDFSRKKEIRAHMYRLREERLRNLYSPEPALQGKGCEFTSTQGHGRSFADQTFQSMKSKEVRDAASPAKEFTYRGQDLKELSNAGWNVESENSTTDNGHTRVRSVQANIEGRYDVDGGTGQFAATDHHKQAATEYQDDNTSLKRNQSSFNTAAHEQVVRQTDDGTEFKSSTSSSTSTSKFEQISSTKQETVPYVIKNESDMSRQTSCDTNRDIDHTITSHFTKTKDNGQTLKSNDYTTLNNDQAELISRKVEYPDENTKIIVETRCLPDGTRVTSTRREFRAPVVKNSRTEQHSQKTRTDKSSFTSSHNRSEFHESSNKVSREDSDRKFQDIVDHQKATDLEDFRKYRPNDTYDREEPRSTTDNRHHNQNRYRDDTNQTVYDTQKNTHEQHFNDITKTNKENYTETVQKRMTQEFDDTKISKNKKHEISNKNEQPRYDVREVDQLATNNLKDFEYTDEKVEKKIQNKEIIDVVEKKTTHQTDYSQKKISNDWSPTHQAWANTLRADTPSITRPSTRASSPGSKTFKSSNSSLRSSVSPDKTYKKPPSRGGSPNKNDRYSPSRTSIDRFSSSTTTETHQNKYTSPEKRYPNSNSPTRQSSSPNRKSHERYHRESLSPEKNLKDIKPKCNNESKPNNINHNDNVSKPNRHTNIVNKDKTIQHVYNYQKLEDKISTDSALHPESSFPSDDSPICAPRRSTSPEKKTAVHTEPPATNIKTKSNSVRNKDNSTRTSPLKDSSPSRDTHQNNLTKKDSKPSEPISRDSTPDNMVSNRSTISPQKKQAHHQTPPRNSEKKPFSHYPDESIDTGSSSSPERARQPSLNDNKSGHTKSYSLESTEPRDTTSKRISTSPNRNSELRHFKSPKNVSPERKQTNKQINEPSPTKHGNVPTDITRYSDDNPSTRDLSPRTSPARSFYSPDKKPLERRQPSLSPERKLLNDDKYSTITNTQKTHHTRNAKETETNNKTRKLSSSPDKHRNSTIINPRSPSPSKRPTPFTTSQIDDHNVSDITKCTSIKNQYDMSQQEVKTPTDNVTNRKPWASKYDNYDKELHDVKDVDETKITYFTHTETEDLETLKSLQKKTASTIKEKEIPDSPTRKSPRNNTSPFKSPGKDYKHTSDFINIEKVTEETNKKSTNRNHPRQLVTPSTSPTRKFNLIDKAPSTGQSSPTTSVSGFVYYSSPRPEENADDDHDRHLSHDKPEKSENPNEITDKLNRRSHTPSKIPCRSPSPEKSTYQSKDSLPRKSSLKKYPNDFAKSSPTENPPTDFCVSPTDVKKDFPKNATENKNHIKSQNDDSFKPKPPLERRETYEERCRKILGMIDNSNKITSSDVNSCSRRLESSPSSPSISPCTSPEYQNDLLFQREKNYIENKVDASEFISREQEENKKTTKSYYENSTLRETSPTKLQDIISQPKTVKKNLSSTVTDGLSKNITDSYRSTRSSVSPSKKDLEIGTKTEKKHESSSYPRASSPGKTIASAKPLKELQISRSRTPSPSNKTQESPSYARVSTPIRNASPAKQNPHKTSHTVPKTRSPLKESNNFRSRSPSSSNKIQENPSYPRVASPIRNISPSKQSPDETCGTVLKTQSSLRESKVLRSRTPSPNNKTQGSLSYPQVASPIKNISSARQSLDKSSDTVPKAHSPLKESKIPRSRTPSPSKKSSPVDECDYEHNRYISYSTVQEYPGKPQKAARTPSPEKKTPTTTDVNKHSELRKSVPLSTQSEHIHDISQKLKTSECSENFIKSERQEEILDRVQKSLRKLSPDRNNLLLNHKNYPDRKYEHTTNIKEKNTQVETEDSCKIKGKSLSEDTTIKHRPSKGKDETLPSKLPSRSISPQKKSNLVKNGDSESPVKSRSISPRKPISPIERQIQKSIGMKSKESITTHLTNKPSLPTKVEKSVVNKDSKKSTVTTKQTNINKITTIQTNKLQQSNNKLTEQEMKRQTLSTKGTDKEDTITKVTRTTSDSSIKVNKAPQKVKNKPEVKVSNITTTKLSRQIHNTNKVLKSKPRVSDSKLDKPKSSTTLNTSTEDNDVMIDVQLAKSSRESSPDHICPTPVNFQDDVGTPRLPDEVSEPDDNYRKRTYHTIHETETIVDDIVEINEDDELFVKRPETENVSKKVQPQHNDFKSDECLLSVSEKVNKFAKGSRNLKESKSPTRNIVDEYDNNTVYQDDYTKLSVNDKAHFFVETAEKICSNKNKTPKMVERPDFSNVDDSLKSDDCLLSVSDKVNKFVKTAEQFLNETNEDEEKDRKIKAQHEKLMKKIVQESEDELEEDKALDRKSPERNKRLGSFAKDTTSSHAKAKDFASPNLKPSEKSPAVKITSLRSSEAVKKAKELFENISSVTQKVNETKTTKLTDIGVIKKPSKSDATIVLQYPLEDKNTEITDVDNEVDDCRTPTAKAAEDRVLSNTNTQHHYTGKQDNKIYETTSTTIAQSAIKYRTKSPMQQSIETANNKTTALKCSTVDKNEDSPHTHIEKHTEHVPSYQRPTKTSQLKEEPKIIEDTVSSRRGSGKFGVELRRTSTERSTVSSERRRSSVEHHQPCIEDIYDLDLLEQMLEKVVGYEQRRRIRSQIRIAKKKVENEIRIDTNTFTKIKNTNLGVTKTKSPERHSKPATLKTGSPERHSVQNTTKKNVSPERSQPKEHDQSMTNGYAKDHEKTSHRSRSPSKLNPNLTRKTVSPIRQPSPEKKTRKSSPSKTASAKPKVNRFNEYASAYMKRVGLGDNDKIISPDSKTKKNTDISDQMNVKRIQENKVTHTESNVILTSTSHIETTASESTEIIQSNGKRTPSPDSKRSPQRKLQSSTERLQQRSPSPKIKRVKPDNVKKETIIKTVYDIEKKIQPKQMQEERPSWVTNRNLKKITSETRTYSSKKLEPEKPKYRPSSPSKVISKPTDVITSSYGPGPLDADGKPLFGIKALRNGATNYQVKGTVIRQEFHSRNGGEPEGTVSVTAYSTEPDDLEKLLQAQGEKPSRIHGLAAITTTKKFGGDTGTTLKEAHSKEERSTLEEFTQSNRRVAESRARAVAGSRVVEKREEAPETRAKSERRDGEKKTVRQSSVKSLTEKYIKSAAETGRPVSGSYPKAGLILRSANMKDSVSSDSSAHAGLARTDSEHSLGSADDTIESFTTSQQTKDGSYTTTTTRRIHTETRQGHVEGRHGHVETRQGHTETRQGHAEPQQGHTEPQKRQTGTWQGHTETRQCPSERSFLDSSTKVTGVQDILTRMKNADIVIEDGDTMEDSEARALLNKFLGASVLMAGMQGYVADTPAGNCVIKQETVHSSSSSGGGKVTSSRVQEVDLDQCWDERVLRTLLDECTDYELRRRLRARLRTLMAEQEACTSAVTEALAAAEAAPTGGEGGEAREEEAVTTVTSSVRRNSSEKTNTTTTTTTKTSKVTESLPRAPPKPVSPFAKFRQLEKQNSTNSPKM